MAKARTFHVSDVLSISNGRLVSTRHVDGIYDILNWLTQDNLFTHQLPRASEECRPWQLRWFPELEKANTAEANAALDAAIDESGGDDGCTAWMLLLRELYGIRESYELKPIPRDDHEHKDPYDEMVQMRGTDEGIIILDAPAPDGGEGEKA